MERSGLIVAVVCLSTGCLRLNWTRETRYEPVEPAALQQLEQGGLDLERCLALLGAPLWVWEDRGGRGALLAYGWFKEKNVGFNVSAPVSDYYSATFEFDQMDTRMRGLVLFFDADWRLVSSRTGLLRDLTREARRPPADVDLLEAEAEEKP